MFRAHGIDKVISQPVIAFFGVNTVGVKGDKRVYAGFAVVRAVETLDFMTAKGVHLSEEVEDDIQTAVTRHPRIVRAFFDPTDKPPGTTEME